MIQNRITSRAVAVLVDGENVSHIHSPEIFKTSAALGDLRLRRVYANVKLVPGWVAEPAVRVVHSETGKNSADMLLAIEAVDLACTGGIDAFVLVTSDGDFSHLACYLREKGHFVIGIGESKAPLCFRRACSQFIQLKRECSLPVGGAPSISAVEKYINEAVTEMIPQGGLRLTALANQMFKRHGLKISSHPQKTWRAYLNQYPERFQLDPRGANARVYLKGCSGPPCGNPRNNP